jgi:hypothetical protein
MPALARLATLALALLLVSAGPQNKVIPLAGGDGESMVIPNGSPVQFQGWGKNDVAHFRGRFILAGTYSYGCEFCDDWPIKDDELSLKVTPDPALASRLPHWKLRSGHNALFVDGSERLNRSIGTAAERRALKGGKLSDIHGRITILVDHFDAGIECDGATYSVHLVAILERPTVEHEKLDGSYGCG